MRHAESSTESSRRQVAALVNAVGATLAPDAEQALTEAATVRLIRDLFGDDLSEGVGPCS